MRQNVVKQMQLKADAVSVAILDRKPCVTALKPDKMVIVISRRDLIWLQNFFAGLDRGHKPYYKAMQATVKENLDALTRANNAGILLSGPKDAPRVPGVQRKQRVFPRRKKVPTMPKKPA